MRHGRRDGTHAEIRDGLRRVFGSGAVHDTADLGDGFPDLVLGARGTTFLLEVKRDSKVRMRPVQAAALASWRGGPWLRVVSLADALLQVGAELERRGIAAPRLAS